MAPSPGPPARPVFLGTSEFAAAVLEQLAASPHRPSLVVTRPDRPRGRGRRSAPPAVGDRPQGRGRPLAPTAVGYRPPGGGRRLAPPPVAETARALGIEVYQPESVNDAAARDRIAAAHPEVICVCAFGALIKEPLLSDYEILNVHPSLLPRWRGAAPIERAIIAGDAETGVSIMRVSAGLDSGPVCLQEREPIGATDTYGTLSERLQGLGGELLVRALDERPPFHDQDDGGATYAAKIEPADRLLDPARTAAELERQVRALTPHVGAYAELADGGRLGVREAVAVDAGPPPGTLSLDGARPVLGCAEGALELVVVQPSGRRAMAGEAYLRGRR